MQPCCWRYLKTAQSLVRSCLYMYVHCEMYCTILQMLPSEKKKKPCPILMYFNPFFWQNSYYQEPHICCLTGLSVEYVVMVSACNILHLGIEYQNHQFSNCFFFFFYFNSWCSPCNKNTFVELMFLNDTFNCCKLKPKTDENM